MKKNNGKPKTKKSPQNKTENVSTMDTASMSVNSLKKGAQPDVKVPQVRSENSKSKQNGR